MIKPAGNPKIVIVGSGIDLLQSALAAAKLLSFAKPSITAIEVEAPVKRELMSSFSDMAHFHSLLGINEGAFIKNTCSGLSFGAELYCENSDGFVFSDGPYGFIIERLGFHELFHKVSSAGGELKYDEYCLSALLAKANRVAPRSRSVKSIFSTVRYGYLIQRERYQAYLTSLLQSIGVTFLRAESLSVESAASDGNASSITQIVTSSGLVFTADLFIDCSHSRALINQVLESHHPIPVESKYLPAYRLDVKHRAACEGERRSSSRIDLIRGGFDRHLAHLNVAMTESLRYQGFDGQENDEGLACYQSPSMLKFPFAGNCVAIGAACSTIPTPLPGAYHLLQNQLLLLFDLWSGGRLSDSSRDIYNSFSVQTCRHNVDIANMLLFRRAGSPIELTQANRERLQLFEASGAVRATESAVIADDHWVALLIALGYRQREPSLKSCTVTTDVAMAQLDKLRVLLVKAIGAAEPYESWVATNISGSSQFDTP